MHFTEGTYISTYSMSACWTNKAKAETVFNPLMHLQKKVPLRKNRLVRNDLTHRFPVDDCSLECVTD